MSGLYKNETEQNMDVIIANSVKVFSVGANGQLVPASKLEVLLAKEEKAAAIARLSIHKAMTE